MLSLTWCKSTESSSMLIIFANKYLVAKIGCDVSCDITDNEPSDIWQILSFFFNFNELLEKTSKKCQPRQLINFSNLGTAQRGAVAAATPARAVPKKNAVRYRSILTAGLNMGKQCEPGDSREVNSHRLHKKSHTW